jgi:hypothetical protein
MDTMTASSRRDVSLSSPAPSAAETTRFPTAAAYAAALEAQALAAADERRARLSRPGSSASLSAASSSGASSPSSSGPPPGAGSPMGESAVSLRELRVLLEENLTALRAVYEDQRRTIASALIAVDTVREEIRALGQPDAPWIAALDETRGLIRAAFAEIAAHHVARR